MKDAQKYCLNFVFLGQWKKPSSSETIAARNFSNADFSDATTASGRRDRIDDRVGRCVISHPPSQTVPKGIAAG